MALFSAILSPMHLISNTAFARAAALVSGTLDAHVR